MAESVVRNCQAADKLQAENERLMCKQAAKRLNQLQAELKCRCNLKGQIG